MVNIEFNENQNLPYQFTFSKKLEAHQSSYHSFKFIRETLKFM